MAFVYFEPNYGHLRGKQMFMECNRAFSFNMEGKEDNDVVWQLIYELWNQLDFKKTPSLLSIIASIVFKDSYGIKCCISRPVNQI